jgi:hypothetical protein
VWSDAAKSLGVDKDKVLKLERSHLGHFFRLSKKEETAVRKKLNSVPPLSNSHALLCWRLRQLGLRLWVGWRGRGVGRRPPPHILQEEVLQHTVY